VSQFWECAESLFETAGQAVRNGQRVSEISILITGQGGLRMVVESDWPLEALRRHHGAQLAYRVAQTGGGVRLEGTCGATRCLIETPAEAAARLEYAPAQPYYRIEAGERRLLEAGS
jgi:hypothetical protein